MTTHTGAPAPGLAADDAGPVWHTLSVAGVLQAESVDERSGLSSAEAAVRAERFGPNKFDAGKSEPRWRAFLRQFADLMQIVLLVAGVVSLALQEWETGIVLIVLTLFNAVLGLQQEGKAAAAVAALQQAENRVEQRQHDQDDAGLPLLQRQAHQAGHQQDDLHQVGVLAEEGAPPGLRFPGVELVRAEPLGPRGRFG